MASAEGKKAKSSQPGGLRRRSGSQQTLRTPTIQRQPGAAVTLRGWLYKQGSDGLMLWKKRWFVLSQYCLFYYQGAEEEKVLGSILLPSYRIIPCGSEDKVHRKYGFKAEHHNTRTYYFAADNKESMIQWMNALSLAAILLEDNGDFSARNSGTFSSSLFTNGGDRTLSKAAHSSSAATAVKYADVQPLNCSFDSTASSSERPHRQPVYANAPPKPKRLNTSLEYSSSPDTTQLIAQQQQQPPATAMPSTNAKENYARNGTALAAGSVSHHHQAMYSSERRTPDAYGRFKADYEDVYNNGSCSSGSSRTPSSGPANYSHMSAANSSATLGRVPRPQSADFLGTARSRDSRKSLQQPQQLMMPRPDPVGLVAEPKKTTSFWSEENYAHQLRQASILQNYPRSRDSSHSSGNAAAPQQFQQQQQHLAAPVPRVARQEEISRDVKESALWSYVQQHASKNSSRKLASSTSYGISNSQENLADEPVQPAPYFARSASARITRGRHPDVLNISLPPAEYQKQQQQQHLGAPDMRTTEQREESMKRLLEWKQRMLQSPLTRKSGQRSGSERNTPTPQSLIDSPRLSQRREPFRSPKSPESYQTLTIPPRREQLPGPGETRRPSQSPASSPLYSNVNAASETGSLPRPVAPCVDSCDTPKASKTKLNEADVRKEFTYEYVNDSVVNGNVAEPKPEVWPIKKSTLMREKSSAMQDLRARSESPSANKVLGRDGKLPTPPKEPEKVTPPKVRPKPPPKPIPPVPVTQDIENQPQDRNSLAESLPESLAGFAATIISEETGSLQEVTVSPIPSENGWPEFSANPIHSPKGKEENLYMNTAAESQFAAVEDHYLPMTSARTSILAQPSPVSFASKPEFEENTYVEMNDGEPSRRGGQSKSVFAGIMDPSYCPPESPRYSEISDSNFEEQPHYEFIYKASSHHYEPVYMEVPQNDEDSTIISENTTEIMDLSGSVASLKSALDQNGIGRIPSAVESENRGDPPQDLDLLIPPRHPRFSLSDTFRPASYFLNTGKKTVNRLETIPAKEEGEIAEEMSISPVPPIPPVNPHVDSFLSRNHSRSQSLDETRPGSSSSRRISLPGSPSTRSGSADASKRRPLTEVRSLEDLLNESVANSTFQEESSSSLVQPLYENVASGGGNGAARCTPDAELVAGARLTNNASTVHQRVNSTLSSLSLASSASTSSVTRSEHSGAPYYYSDLIAGNKVPSQVNLPTSGRDSSLRGRLYNKHGERLRPNSSRDLERHAYGSNRHVNSSLSTLGRSQTPDLLNNCNTTTSSTLSSRTPGIGGDVMRRVRSLEGLLDEENNTPNTRTSLVSPAAMSPRPPSVLTETPRYARDPTTFRKARENRAAAAEASDMSPWDEDRLWREKLRNASLRHSRSLDMLDESQEPRPRREAIAGEESERYERLLQYSATLERSKRGQTYLDGYVWDEVEQRFRKSDRDSDPAGKTSTNPGKRFLEERLPPAFEIDREKLRQWDLMSSAPISNATGKGGRQTSNPRVIIDKAQQAWQGQTVYRRQPLSPTHGRQIQLSPPGNTAKTGGGSSNAETLGKPAGMNGTSRKDVTYERAPNASGSPERTPPFEEAENSDSDIPLRKGKLPAMIGHNRNGSESSDRLPLSAGDLLGRTHEELVLLLIQLRRQSSALIKARDACILEMESQVKVASLDLAHRQECLAKVGDLKRHVKELEKQMEKLKPLVNLVDNMVKLGSLYPNEKRLMNSTAPKTPLKITTSPIYSNIGHYATLPHAHQQPRAPQQQQQQQHQHQYSPLRRPEPQESPYTYMERQRDQLELKRQQLSRLERFVQEEGAAIQKLTQNENVLKLALRGVRDQSNAALRTGNYPELEHCRVQQDYLERELSAVHSLLAQSSKRLEDKAVEISRIEQEISALHQQLHRVGRSSTLRSSHSQTASQSGRELSWLEAELSRVQQHVSQLQTRRQELTSQINRLTDHQLQTKPAVPAASWYETDLDTMYTYDQGASLPVWDINEADERMKRYYGIIPKEKPAEIRTVRLVKREAGKRKTRKPEDVNFDSQDEMLDDSVASTVTEEEGYHTSSQDPDDPILTDPVLSQFSHVLTLPRRKDNKRLSNPELNNSPIRIVRRPASSLSLVEPACPPAGGEEEASLESGSQPSPILTPVYTSDAAREIIEEMRRQEMMANRRSVPRHKRRHLTVSCSQPLALEAKANTPTPLMGGSKVRARDDLDMERALRFQHPFAPDVVRSTIGRPLRITDRTIDKILAAPDKILIPERYVPEQEVDEPDEEEKRKRLQKTESIRRMLAGSTPVELPRPPTEGGAASETLRPSEARQLLAKERRQRDHFIGLNRVLAEEMKEKSKMVAVVALAKMTSRNPHSSDEEDWSPPADPLPLYQQRYNYLT